MCLRLKSLSRQNLEYLSWKNNAQEVFCLFNKYLPENFEINAECLSVLSDMFTVHKGSNFEIRNF